MKRVVVFGLTGMRGVLSHPILNRPEFHVAEFSDFRKALVLFESEPADLLIWEQVGSVESGLRFLRRVSQVMLNEQMKAVCLWKDMIPEYIPKFIHRSFPFPPDPEEYEHVLSYYLDGPNREQRRYRKRYMFRMSPSLLHGERGTICSSVNLSEGGILIESSRPLQIGRTYKATLLGLSNPGPIDLNVRILRENTRTGYTYLHYYAGLFENLSPEDEEHLRMALDR